MLHDANPQTAPLSRFECCINNNLQQVTQLCELVTDWTIRKGIRGMAERHRIAVPLEEAMVNAVIHGNLELASSDKEKGDDYFWSEVQRRCRSHPYSTRAVRVIVDLSDDSMTVSIRDEGPGFDPDEVANPTDSENLEIPSGRGLLLMRSFMDEVDFNDMGNEVTLTAHRSVRHAAATA
ncbi:MAG: ATP-binding protein [Planctomycetota bacterium]|nr:ATP-binding protein [Planctomycetota bacterium]